MAPPSSNAAQPLAEQLPYLFSRREAILNNWPADRGRSAYVAEPVAVLSDDIPSRPAPDLMASATQPAKGGEGVGLPMVTRLWELLGANDDVETKKELGNAVLHAYAYSSYGLRPVPFTRRELANPY